MEPLDLTKVKHHPVSEQIVNMLRKVNQNTESDGFFRVLTSFYLAQVASTMRATVVTEDRGEIPVNMYCLLNAPSGFGKTKSVNLIERELLKGFYDKFLTYTLPEVVKEVLDIEAVKQANRNGSDFEEELTALKAEYDSYGAYVFSFPEGSGPAYRQVRAKSQMASIGSTNLIVDELGFNILKIGELLDVHFEVFDIGVVKDKITKAGADNKRYKQRSTAVPANLLAFGTPEKLFDGAACEREIMTRFEAGYARRLLFGAGSLGEDENISAEELYDRLVKCSNHKDISDLTERFTALADPVNKNWQSSMEREQGILLVQYKLWCEYRARGFAKHDGIRIAEMQHRYFRALKLAGTYSFIDSTALVSNDQLLAAIKVVEESGQAFNLIMNRPKAHVRLAQYVADVNEEVTHADILEALPFYPVARNKQEEMWALAVAWGHRNHCVIKRYMMDGIDFFKGEALQETNLDQLRISYSNHAAYHFQNKECSWQQLQDLCQVPDTFFLNHHVVDGHRCDDNVIQGTDFLVLDCDGDVTLSAFSAFMAGTLCHVYTTKSHTPQSHHFRAIIPLKYRVNLNKEDYKDFVNNILTTLPYTVKDDCGNQRSKRWSCNQGGNGTIKGELFDPIPYLPHTKKNTDRLEDEKNLKNLDKVQKFFAKQWSGGRNNTLLRYAMMLLDTGMDLQEAIDKVRSFNKSFSDPLDETEMNDSVFVSMGKKVAKI